jgi:ribose transport system permease protein
VTDLALPDRNRRRWQSVVYFVSAQRGILLAVAIFVVMFGVYGWKQEVGLSPNIINTAANKGTLLALVAMAQTIVVITGGLDLSVGMIFLLTNCLASVIVNGDPLMTGIGVIGVLLVGLLCGTVNGIIVVYGRLQPIIVTLAMSAVYFGLAVVLRPQPGGSVNFELAAGLMLTFLTYSGGAKVEIGNDYTLNSIAAVVIGGTSLFGGVGSVIGSIFGAFVMRTVGDLLIVFDINPVLQPLFVGVVLLLAVCIGSLRLLRIKNKVDLYR